MAMDDRESEPVLYETLRRASRPYTPLYPPQQIDNGDSGGFLSMLSVQGVNRLKEKWLQSKQLRKLRKLSSLFISPSGELVAVAAGNQITILQKKDDYSTPCGTFTTRSLVTFSTGTWSESHAVLGVVDDTDTLYFIKANGDEIVRITKRQLKVSSAIVKVLANEDSDVHTSYLCSFTIVTSDGSIQHIEITREANTSINNGLTQKGKLVQNVCSVDYHLELSLLAVLSCSDNITHSTGSWNLSIWRKSNSIDFEQMFTIQFEGSYTKPKEHNGRLAYPKVVISPEAEFICTLDAMGGLHTFKMDKKYFSLSKFDIAESCVDNSIQGREFFNDAVDFTWWSDHVLAIAKRTGVINMINICSGIKVQENDPVYSMPVLERVYQLQGNLFLLESMVNNLSHDKGTDESLRLEHITEEINHFEVSKLSWNLVTFLKRSVPEMYGILISNKRYQAALDFANSHGLDKDEVIKSQWLSSTQGINEVSMYLSKIEDKAFVLSQCVDKVGSIEDSTRALLEYGLRLTNQYRYSDREDSESAEISDFRMGRLQILQFRDKLETYLGINMGRFSVQDYAKFRIMPINEAAVALAESGKMGALNLLFKRHPYSLAPFILEILSSIPETLPVQTYVQLLPGMSPPSSTVVREEDWVECKKMVKIIHSLKNNNNNEIDVLFRTEPILKQCVGFVWPSRDELSTWYKNRARDIDLCSGQLDNSLSLLDFANRKGISELKEFHDDVLYLHQLIYSDETDGELDLNLATWEQLSNYEKFRMMLKGVAAENVVKKLRDKAIPFMKDRDTTSGSHDQVTRDHLSGNADEAESFLTRWMKEMASQNKLDICLRVVEEGGGDMQPSGLFRDEIEAIICALQCLYLSKVTDKWSTMTAILSKLPQMQGSTFYDAGLERRLKLAEGHIEVGRLLSSYQVPKPLDFFLESHGDGKGVKQILRLILSKFVRRQPGRSDNEWASMWRDMQCMREKAFPFLDPEYMLMEFCRGLLKAGKFSLARNYLKGTGSVALSSDKAENLVVQAAREYFFSASSLNSPEIWKARDCLNLLSNSRVVTAELDTIDALTIKLPNLGVTLLPMQFRQIKDPMEIIKMAITSQTGAYLHVDEIIEIAKLFGLSSGEDISAVQEAIAREAAVAGDLQLAFDLCLLLAKKGHGQVWDLCAAISRGPALENMDIETRKRLLGFALSHCDEESLSELLHAWKDLDMQGQCEMLIESEIRVNRKGTFAKVERTRSDDHEGHISNIIKIISVVAKDVSVEKGKNWEAALEDNGKTLSFAASQLPWLLELISKAENTENSDYGAVAETQCMSVRTQAVLTILSWLARNGFAPKDFLIASLAKSMIEPPITEEKCMNFCSYLLNLVDASGGIEVIEEELKRRNDYQEISSIMNVGMMYSLLHNYGIECRDPAQRRVMLLRKFREKQTPDEIAKLDEVQSTFWREWKQKLEEQKFVADRSRALEKIVPGVDAGRFLSGDTKYIESVVLSLVESVKLEKKHILKDVLNLADTYGLNRTEVLLNYLSSLLVSEVWTNDDIIREISACKDEITGSAIKTVQVISSTVYPEIDGFNKLRLALVFGLLSDCCLQLEEAQKSLPKTHPELPNLSGFGFSHYYKVIEQECLRVSTLTSFNFKNIAGLRGLNLEFFNREIYQHIDNSSLEVLAKMVETLTNIYTDSAQRGLISWKDVYKYYLVGLLENFETKARTDVVKKPENLQGLICELEQKFDSSRKYIKCLEHSDALEFIKRYFMTIVPLNNSYGTLPDDSTWQDCLLILLNCWIKFTDEMKEIVYHDNPEDRIFTPDCLMTCLNVFMRLVIEDNVSPSQGWLTLLDYVNHGLSDDPAFEIFTFCKAMIFSGCVFSAVAEVFSEALSGSTELQDLPSLFLKLLEPILQVLASGEVHEHQNFFHILTSVSKSEGNLEDLKQVRHAIWKRLAKFSDDLNVPGSVRVYILELMEFLAGKDIKGPSSEIHLKVIPWEGWAVIQYTSEHTETSADRGSNNDTSTRVTSTLVALKSSQLAARISPGLDVKPDDLSSVESATNCFFKLCGVTETDQDCSLLVAVLGEWEGIFSARNKEEEEPSSEPSEAGNMWNSDDWDEGWESFQDPEPQQKNENASNTVSLHPLHLCWFEIFKKLVKLSSFKAVLRLIDQSNALLLDEESAKTITEMLLRTDCLVSLQLVLLLPYEALRTQCLTSFEEKLRREGFVRGTIKQSHEFLILVLSSGIIPRIVSESAYGTIFSYACYLVGNLSRKSRENQVSRDSAASERDWIRFRRIVFPYFVSEIVKADQHLLAGLIVTKFMHTNASLSLVNIAEPSLVRFLEKQLHVLRNDQVSIEVAGDFHETLKNSVSGLAGKLENVVRSALTFVSNGYVK